jgi:hypothetical protein
MTETLIALISIVIGISGANFTGLFWKKYSFGLTGNTILGVFGSIFFIKSLGRLGFDPVSIMHSGKADFLLIFINFMVSFLGGAVAVILAKILVNKVFKK